MPTYQYTCTECGEPVEALQKFTDAPLTVCSACGGRLRKVFSPVGIVFKGSGFYRTDSRNGEFCGYRRQGQGRAAGDTSRRPRPNRPPQTARVGGQDGDKKSETARTAAKSSSSSEKVA